MDERLYNDRLETVRMSLREAGLERLLDKRIIDLVALRGWKSLTEVQIEAIKSVLRGSNVLIISPTGSGKTEAAILPVLSMMLSDEEVRSSPGVYVLYITPMKALINDLYKRIKWWSDRLGFSVSRKHGDVPGFERARRLKRVPHILIITPENLQIDLDWSVRFREYYQRLKWVIIDEVHELINSKRGVQLAILLERLKRISGNDFQRIMLSATIGDPDYVIKFFSGSSSRENVVISSRDSKKIRIYIKRVETGDGEVFDKIAESIRETYTPTTIVFVNSRYLAERIHEALERIGVERVYVHHSSISSKIKEDIESMIRNGDANIVVATRTLELGVDLGSVDRVILFRSPGQVSSLVQRVGRSRHSLDKISEGYVILDREIDLLEIFSLVKLLVSGYIERPRRFCKPMDLVARTIVGMSLRGAASIEEIYSVIRSTYVYRDLSYEEFMRVVDYLSETKIIERHHDDSVRIGKNFFSIWSFDKKSRIKSFSKFFTYIRDNDTYIVRSDGEVIGALDESYVYRVLRPGDVIRLSGRLWRVVRIDDHNRIISVSKVESSEGFIPLWNGDIISRSRSVARALYDILRRESEEESAISSIIDSSDLETLKRIVDSYREWFRKNNVPIPSEDLIVVEDRSDEKIILYPFGDRLAELVAYLLLNEAFKRIGRDVETRISAYGVSLRANGADPIKILRDICESGEIEEYVRLSLLRSPRLKDKIREIQYSFGRVSNPEEDEFIVEEAVKQILSEFEDEYGIYDFMRDLCSGRLKIYRFRSREPSPISRVILSTPPTRLWLKDIGYSIVKTLKNTALTVSELAEILELPEDFIESKLKELRKSEDSAVVYFRDVNSGDIRWVLVEDLYEISRDPLFEESFKPVDLDELFEISYRSDYQTPLNTLILRARDVCEPSNVLERSLRGDEVYEIKIRSVNRINSNSISFYNIKREAVRFIVLNGISVLQRSED